MIKISNGNKKIGNDTFIINITSATDCPSRRLGLCQIEENKCYAMKAERQYPDVLPYRRAQEIVWETHHEEIIAEHILSRAKRKKTPIKYIRFSESGDFRSQEDVEKLKNLSHILSSGGIKVYGYTARRDLSFSDLPSNLAINGSGFMVSNSFTAVKESQDDFIMCPGNCRNCNLCKEKNNLDIKVLYH
jgi:hypothetical protein